LLVHAAYGARREPAAGDAAVTRVLGRIHVEQIARGILGRRRQIEREDREARRVEEQLRLLADGDDVGVLGDRPEGVDVRPLVPEDRAVLAQPRPFGMRIAVFLVGLRSDEIERRWLKGALRCVHRAPSLYRNAAPSLTRRVRDVYASRKVKNVTRITLNRPDCADFSA